MPGKGRLIALEGSGGRSMAVAARLLQRSLRGDGGAAGISKWDASGIFFDILQGPRDLPGASPRTLALLYACDLAFRLRWEIRPALEEGMTVIAAPYVDSAIAVGRSAGLPRVWLRELLEFAPAADASYRVPEDSIPASARPKPSESFLEFCFVQLRRGTGSWNTEELRRAFLDQLKSLEARGKCRLATQSSLAAARRAAPE